MKFNRSSRAYRLVMGFILPPFLGTVIVMGISVFEVLQSPSPSYGRLVSSLWYFPVIFLAAMFFIGVQSLVFSLVMEFLVRPRLPGRGNSLLAGGFLGSLAGLVPGLLLQVPEFFIPVGLVVGVAVGWLICERQ